MDTAVQTMKQQQHQRQQQQLRGDTPSLTSDDNSSVDSHDNPTPPMTDSRNSYQLTTTNCSSITPSWTLEVTKGSLCFKTQVKTHGDLLYHAQNLTQVIQLNDSIPFGVPRDPERLVLMQTMGVRLLYKCNKTRYKNALLILENISGTWKHDDYVYNDSALTTTTPSLSPTLGTTLALVFAYVECPHFYHWAIGIPTFYRLFIQPLMENDQSAAPVSSALYAFCAVICTMNCDHVSKVLPGSLLSYYGQFYYEQARLSLADRFDDTSLELVTTYVFMAVYHWNLSQEDKSIRYADMAQRMAYLVLATDFGETDGQHYLDNSDSKDDTIHFYRIITYLKQTCAYETVPLARPYRQNLDLAPILDKLGKRMASFDNTSGNIPPALSATRLLQDEPRFLRYHAHHRELQELIQTGYHYYDRTSENFVDVVRQVCYHLKHSIEEWYVALEPDFKIPELPLWKAPSITDEDYLTTLEQKCNNNIVPALMTLALYEELIVQGLGALPKNPRNHDDSKVVTRLSEFWHGGNDISQATAQQWGLTNLDKWRRRIKKLNEIKDEIHFKGTNAEFVSLIRQAFYSHSTRYEYPILETVFHATLNAVRICQYLQQRRWQGAYCYFDKRVVYSAKFMLERFLIAGDDLPPGIKPFGDLIRQKVDMCDDMLRADDGNLRFFEFGNEDSYMAS
ncbi:unnamed protein product [Absidia cylindrospora]